MWRVIEGRGRFWDAEGVIFEVGGEDGCGAAVRVLDTVSEDGDVFDALLDTTLVGNVPEHVIPSGADNIRAGLCAFRPQTQDTAGRGGVFVAQHSESEQRQYRCRLTALCDRP